MIEINVLETPQNLREQIGIFINEDVSKATQEIRRTKMPELMEKRKAGMIAYFSGTHIVTRSRQAQPSTHREQRAADLQLNENSDFSERVRSLEDCSRSSNIIIDGIPETNDESNERLQVDISKILSEKMKVTPKISTCHRIGNKTPSRNRPIIVKLSSQDDRNKCLRNAPKLKGTNIFINEDVS